VVYSRAAIEHLRRIGFVVFLDAPLDEIRARIGDPGDRGLVRQRRQSLADLYAERRPLYLAACDAVVDCRGRSQSEVADSVLAALDAAGRGRPL
jgi:shikimate kinase